MLSINQGLYEELARQIILQISDGKTDGLVEVNENKLQEILLWWQSDNTELDLTHDPLIIKTYMALAFINGVRTGCDFDIEVLEQQIEDLINRSI